MINSYFKIDSGYFNHATVESLLNAQFKLSSKFTLNDQFTLSRYYDKSVVFSLNPYGLFISYDLNCLSNDINSSSVMFHEVEQSITFLSEVLEIDLSYVEFSGMSIAFNIVLNQSVNKYLQMIRKPKDFTSCSSFRNTIHMNKDHKLSYIIDDVSKNVDCNSVIKSKNNILKFEVDIRKNTSNMIGYLKLEDLSDINSYRKLIEFWYTSFKSIPMLPSKSPKNLIIYKSNELINWLALEGLKVHGGKEKVFNKISKKNTHTISEYYLRKCLQKIEEVESINSELTIELDEKVKDIYNRELQAIENYKAVA